VAFMEGYVEIKFKCTGKDNKTDLSNYIQGQIDEAKARPDYEEGFVDAYSWLTESGWKPGSLGISCELVDECSADTVEEFLEGIIQSGIKAEFTASVYVFDDMHGEDICRKSFDSTKMR
jgi:hypothetical protein